MSRFLTAAVVATLVYSQSWATNPMEGRSSIEIVVTDFSYYYNGTRTESIESVEQFVLNNLSMEYSVVACSTADQVRVQRLVDLLRINVDRRISLSATNNDDRTECSESN